MRDDPAARESDSVPSVRWRCMRVPAAYAKLAVGCQAARRPQVLERRLGHFDR